MYLAPLDEAKALVAKGDTDQAIQKLSECLNSDFYNDEVLFMLGACLMAKGMNGLAAVITSAAVDSRAALKRKFPEALLNLGSTYKAEHQNDVAKRIWEHALEQETLPRERARILGAMSGLYINEGQPERAVHYCDLALLEDPKNVGVQANRGLACLELGRWREGWSGFRQTYASGDRTKRVYPGIPEWDGSSGKSVIVWGDQGVGDEIYYASCLADMQRVCRRVILDCHPRLEMLFKRSFPEIKVHGTRKTLTELEWLRDCNAEASVCLADLPSFFRNTDDEWGDGAPYLKTAAVSVSPGKRRPRIGLSWTGGTKRTRVDLRSLPIDALAPILETRPDAQWFSLQYTPNAAREVCVLEEKAGIRLSHFPGWVECYDYDMTAAFVASLDLVITVCTTVHHLGGALGIPTWTLVPSRPSWRYQVTGDRLPWYKSARLFRQERDGEWSGPVNAVRAALVDF